MSEAYQLVITGNTAKFTQNKFFRDELAKTKGMVIVEASAKDKRWGIGLAIDDPKIHNPANWRGQNLLGKALTQVRMEIFGE